MSFSRQDVEALSAAVGEPSWVLERRMQAFDYFEKLEIPGEKEEPWRYTDLRRLKFDLDAYQVTQPDPSHEVTAEQLALLEREGGRGGYIVQRDSDIVLSQLDADIASQGVILTDLNTALKEHEELLRDRLFTQTRPDEHIFAALHAALFAGGTFLYVPKGVTVALPIESQRWVDVDGAIVAPHTIIIAEENSEVVYFERYGSTTLKSEALSLGGAEVFVGKNARVTQVLLQEFGEQVWHFHRQSASVDDNVNFRSLVVTLGGKFSRQEVATAMRGVKDNVEMLGLYFAEHGQHFDFRTLQDHIGSGGFSDLLYKGALKNESRTVYSGNIRVNEHAAQTDAYQTNRNLVLSDHAKADSKPELEILNNDVKCSHGASVGHLNESEIFYLMSRGIPREDAERLIVVGFFEEVIGRITNEEIRQVLSDAIERKIAG